MLDQSLMHVNIEIDSKLLPYEGQISGKMQELEVFFNEGQQQQTVIREILDSHTDKTQFDPNYVAYEIMENDPLNE